MMFWLSFKLRKRMQDLEIRAAYREELAQQQIERINSDVARLEADLREVRSTQNAQILARQSQGVGIAALLQEQIEPEETEEQKQMREDQKTLLAFLNRYQGDSDA